MTVKLIEWDGSRHIQSQEECDEYLRLAIESGDPKLVTTALGNIAKAKKRLGLVAQETGLNKAGVYRAFGNSGGNPTLDTYFKVAHALGYGISMYRLTPEEMKRFAAS